jgi:hypothetical protein
VDADGFAGVEGVAGFSGDAGAAGVSVVAWGGFAPSSSGLFVTVDGGAVDGFAGTVAAGGEASAVAGVGCGVSGTFRAHPAAPIIMDKTTTRTRIS